MSTIVTRAVKGTALTYTEMDANFNNLNTDKIQSPLTANLVMGGNKITGSAAATVNGDLVRFEQLPSATNLLPVASGGTASGTPSAARAALGAVNIAGDNLTGGINSKFTTVASAATPDIFATTVGNLIDYTGTSTCTGFVAAPQAGASRTLVCAGAAVFTAGANMLIDGVVSGLNYTCAAGDKVIVRAVTTTQFRLTLQPYAATTANTSMIRYSTCNGNGSTNTAIRRFTTQQTNQGVDITYTDSAANGALFTINTPGVYSISYCDSFSAVSGLGISLNSATLTTAVSGLTAAELLIISETSGPNARQAVAWTGFLPAGSLIRPHTSVTPGNGISTTNTQFTITRMA